MGLTTGGFDSRSFGALESRFGRDRANTYYSQGYRLDPAGRLIARPAGQFGPVWQLGFDPAPKRSPVALDYRSATYTSPARPSYSSGLLSLQSRLRQAGMNVSAEQLARVHGGAMASSVKDLDFSRASVSRRDQDGRSYVDVSVGGQTVALPASSLGL
ncbi:MAG: hypothetical protein JNK82_01730 [Myxococcaceae bacterium]|nr:hypothetical protein [Myxococcaceae bacterium]